MTTFSLLWRRDGQPSTQAAVERLALGLTRLRDDPVTSWTRGPLTVWHFADDPWISVAEHPAGFVTILAGRLDAFADLVAKVGGRDVVGTNPSDAEVLAAAYDKWGQNCFRELIGDFIAVVWDEQTRSLICARDSVGVAPLYRWADGSEVVLSGHVGGVMAHGAVARTPNLGYIAEVISDDWRSATETVYRDVSRLEPGWLEMFRGGVSRQVRYAEHLSTDALVFGSDLECDEHYRALLSEAIGDRLRGRVEVGTTLSGGLDSSTIAAIAAASPRRQGPRSMKSYSFVYPGLECDERSFIDMVVQSSSLDPRYIDGTLTEPSSIREEVLATGNIPTSPNGACWLHMTRLARSEGVGSILTGLGGDQRFDVNSRYIVELALRFRLPEAVSAAKRLSPGASTAFHLREYVIRPVLGNAVKVMVPALLRSDIPVWISKEFADEAELEARLSRRTPHPLNARGSRRINSTDGFHAAVLDANSVIDVFGGVNLAHPFHDRRMIEFATRLDESQRWADGQFRTIQRRAMSGLLPDRVRFRSDKAAFNHLFVETFRLAGGRDRFAKMEIAALGWVRAEVLVRLYDELEASVRNGGRASNIWPLWGALSVDEWWRASTGSARS